MKAARKNVSFSSYNHKVFLLLAVLVFLAQLTFLGVLYDRFSQYRKDNDAIVLSTQLQANAGVYNASLSRVTVAPSENVVYMPELRLKLPINETTLSLVYSQRINEYEPAPRQVTVVSTLAQESYVLPMPQQFSCQPVRLAVETKANPYNQKEIAQPAVKLADGRTLQIYAVHEDTCKAAWNITGADSDKIAKVFQSAQSY